MRLVSKNSDADRAHHRATGEAKAALIDLTVNLLRVVRGAGMPHELNSQMLAFLTAEQAHVDAVGICLSGDQLADALRFEHPHLRLNITSDDETRASDQEDMMRASLQYVASTLAGQPTQQSRADTDFYAVFHRASKALQERRARWEREQAVYKAQERAKKAAASVKAKWSLKKPRFDRRMLRALTG